MKNKFLISIILLSSVIYGTHAHAQTTATQKALEGVKESVGSLVTAKDKNNPNEEAFRTETLKKVIDFSIVEAKDLKIKFLGSFEDPKASTTLTIWRDTILSRINAVISYYEKEKKDIDTFVAQEDGDAAIKEKAEKIKTQREKQFIPLSDEINDFLLVEQQKESVLVAEKRLEKIENDMTKLKKAFPIKKVQPLVTSFEKAGELINEAKDINTKTQELFRQKYLSPLEVVENATTTVAEKRIDADKNNNKDNATTTPTIIPPSIRDLAETSLLKIKGAYRVFIEMSSLVRKLFM